MKKLLVLFLVLGMASLANATLVTVGASDTDMEINDTCVISITVDAGDYLSGYDMALSITGPGTGIFDPMPIYHEEMTEPPFDPAYWENITFDLGWAFAPQTIVPESMTTIYLRLMGAKGGSDSYGMPDDYVANDLGFKKTGAGNITISLIVVDDEGMASYNTDSTDYEDGQVLSSVIIVPEPMTIALLGIGGLGLIRRRRA